MKKFNIYSGVKVSVNTLTYAIAAMLFILAVIIVYSALCI